MSGHVLDGVLKGLDDTRRLYVLASEWVDPDTASLFREIAQRRGWFSAALRAVFQDRPPIVAFRARTRETHFTLHERLTVDHADLLQRFEGAEAELLARYRRALAQELPADVALILAEQYSDVRSTHEEIRAVRYEEEWARAGEPT